MPSPSLTFSPRRGSSWPRRRWWWTVAVVFAAQSGLIVWLGERGPVRPRPPGPVATLRIVGGVPPEVLALEDPTLFALPHVVGFSGPAWLNAAQVMNRPPPWSEEPRTLSLCVEPAGAPANDQGSTDQFASLRPLPEVEPAWALSEPPPLTLSPEASRLRIEGDLARYRRLTPLSLPSWQYNDVLTNSVVQVFVDAAGRPFGCVLLFGGCGYKKADDFALAQARAARFDVSQPAGAGAPGPAHPTHVEGQLWFEWHTEPAPPSAVPPALK